MEKVLEQNYKLKEFETYQINNNSYHVFKVERNEDQVVIQIIWGKTDFRVRMNKTSNQKWGLQLLEILKNNRFYQFVKLSEHGIVYDEFQWSSEEDQDLYIELPKDFHLVIVDVAKSVLNKRGW